MSLGVQRIKYIIKPDSCSFSINWTWVNIQMGGKWDRHRECSILSVNSIAKFPLTQRRWKGSCLPMRDVQIQGLPVISKSVKVWRVANESLFPRAESCQQLKIMNSSFTLSIYRNQEKSCRTTSYKPKIDLWTECKPQNESSATDFVPTLQKHSLGD